VNKRELDCTPLVGKKIVVSDVSGGTYLGLTGEVLEDRENVLVIKDQGKEKKLPKKVCTFAIYDQDRLLGEVRGQDIIGSPEDRGSERR